MYLRDDRRVQADSLSLTFIAQCGNYVLRFCNDQ